MRRERTSWTIGKMTRIFRVGSRRWHLFDIVKRLSTFDRPLNSLCNYLFPSSDQPWTNLTWTTSSSQHSSFRPSKHPRRTLITRSTKGSGTDFTLIIPCWPYSWRCSWSICFIELQSGLHFALLPDWPTALPGWNFFGISSSARKWEVVVKPGHPCESVGSESVDKAQNINKRLLLNYDFACSTFFELS